MPRLPVARCRSCNEPIIWAWTEATQKRTSKRIPIDATTNGWAKEYGNGNMAFAGDQAPDGSPIVRVENGGKHLSHFATCGQADSWRRK